MKQLNVKTSILIASIYAAIFYGVMIFLDKVYPRYLFPTTNTTAVHAWEDSKVWCLWIFGMIAILLFGFLVYQTDWKKKK